MSEIQPAAETDAVAFTGRNLSAAGAGNSQLYRELKYRLKQANKTIGRQGQTIHLLRSELAEVREINGKIERGDIRRLERENQELLQDSAALSAENERMLEKLESDVPVVDKKKPKKAKS